jgi:hypothetical protein
MGDRIFVATRKGLFTLTRTQGAEPRWTLGAPHFLGDPVTDVLHDARDGALYATLNLGHFGVKLRRSDDGGGTWQEIAVPAYPPQPESLSKEPDPFTGRPPAPWKLQQLWRLEAGGADEPGVLWAGTIPGGLFRSSDRGASWSLVESLWNRPERSEWFGGGYDYPGIHSILVDPRDSRHVAIGISCGGVWQTRDGGANWQLAAQGMYAEFMPPERKHDQNIQDVHCIAQCAARPEFLWAQHHNGVFRSVDGAASWQEITAIAPSKFGFAVAAHPRDPDMAWFVPAVKDECRVPVDGKLVVARTRNGGRSFETLGRGLPQQHAYDLVYRHGLAVDPSGYRLAMGSTTGGLWVSEDQGDTWSCISTHLPPVYSVRFGTAQAGR